MSAPITILSVLGTRPEVVKMAPVLGALARALRAAIPLQTAPIR